LLEPSTTARCKTLQLLHGALRHEQRSTLFSSRDPRLAVLAGPQHVVGIRKLQLEAQRAGGGIDGALNRADLSGM
jgi:hypothetical protein